MGMNGVQEEWKRDYPVLFAVEERSARIVKNPFLRIWDLRIITG